MSEKEILRFVSFSQTATATCPTVAQVISSAGMMPDWLRECEETRIRHLVENGLLEQWNNHLAITERGRAAIQ